jgi:hypothetical protein
MLVLAPVFTATATYLPTNMDQPIDPPTEPEPEDGATDLVVNPELSVLVTFSGSGKAVAKFYDAFDDSYIGGDSVVNNSRAYEEWNNLKPLTTYYWYVIVTYEGY